MLTRKEFIYRTLLFTIFSLFVLSAQSKLDSAWIAPVAILCGIVTAFLIGVLDKFINFMERPGDTTTKALILGLLTAVFVGTVLFVLLK
ncbi:MAG: hypothetical protein HYT93_00885 [Parcubacteria group bacterium]|nr:hypothetical protein [Parcubacteria group bacterium]